MTRTVEARMNDVRSVVRAAARVRGDHRELVHDIVASTGLSAAGVELGFAKHLELDPTDDELRRLVARVEDAPSIAVVLSANVFVGALRAVALALAASEDVAVRPSRRDPTFARALVHALGDGRVRLAETLDVASVSRGELHVYGRDETIAEVRRGARPGVRVRGHGAGMGVAFVSRSADVGRAARLVADDVVAFDQRGCLSPRIALVEGDASRAEAFATALDEALARLERAVPRGELSADELRASDRYVATMTYACRALVGDTHVVGLAPSHGEVPLVLPPAGRHVHVASCSSAAYANERLAPIARAIVAVGVDVDHEDHARAFAPRWARVSALGEMQRPRLDGPVDLRDDGPPPAAAR